MQLTVEDLLVRSDTELKQVLPVIDRNEQGIVFVISDQDRLVGVATDGDIRRALMKGLSLESEIHLAMNVNFVSAHVSTKSEDLLKLLGKSCTHVPLVDDSQKVVDFVSAHKLHHIPIMEPYLNGNEMSYLLDCIQTKWISSQGKYILKFEEMFAEQHGLEHAVCVSNGTTALHLAMAALGIGPGDEVIVPDLTFAASINTVLHANATPVVVDVCPKTWCIDPREIERFITPKTKAIMPVHLYGQPCAMDEIKQIAEKNKLFIIEDAAEALGSQYHSKPIGTLGDAGCFSFFGNKTITTGEGGMILFKDEKLAKKAKVLRDHGMDKDRRYWHNDVGYNYRMTNLQAAIGVAQLEQFTEIMKRKTELTEMYTQGLEGCPGITLPPQISGCHSSHWLYTILIENTEKVTKQDLVEKLKLNGIETRPVFYPLSEMPLYRPYLVNSDYQHSHMISRKGLCLPSSVTLDKSSIIRICNVIKKTMGGKQNEK